MVRTTDIDGYPTTCATCTKPVLKTKGSATYETVVATGHKTVWHTECGRPK